MTTQHILWDFYTGVCKFYVFFMTGLWIICWWLTAREKLFFNIWTQRRYIEKFYPQPSYGGKYVITRLQGKPNLSETLFMKKFKLWNLETLKIIYLSLLNYGLSHYCIHIYSWFYHIFPRIISWLHPKGIYQGIIAK